MSGRTQPVWLASYPKSGNTWLRCIVDSLAHGGAPPNLLMLNRRYPWSAGRIWLEHATDVPTSDLTPAELSALLVAVRRDLFRPGTLAAQESPQAGVVKVHERFDPALFPGAGKAIYVVRDPRDIAPSLADHTGMSLNAAVTQMGRDAPATRKDISRWTAGVEEAIGAWCDHVESWLDGFPGPLLLLRYETLLDDPMEETARIARFLGLPDDTRTLAATVASNRFAALRAEEDRAGFNERGERQHRFFRQGRAGVWAESLTDAHCAAIVQRHGHVMARLGYAVTAGDQTMANATPTSCVTRNPNRS